MKRLILAVLLLCGVGYAKDFIMVDLEKIIDSIDFTQELDNDIEFSFGSGSEAEIIASEEVKRGASKKSGKFKKSISGKTYQFFAFEKPCGYALIKDLKKLSKEALKQGGSKVINITSSDGDNIIDEKEKFACIVKKNRVQVRLNADIAK